MRLIHVLSGWMWVNLTLLTWTVLLQWIEPGWNVAGAWLFFFAIAVGAATMRPVEKSQRLS